MGDFEAIRRDARALRERLRTLVSPSDRVDTLTRADVAGFGNLSQVTVRKIEQPEHPQNQVSAAMVGRYLEALRGAAEAVLVRPGLVADRAAFEAHLATLADLRRRLHGPTEPTSAAGPGQHSPTTALPYPVLSPYSDPETFGGRQAEVALLVNRLRTGVPILGVFAESGAGKSSVLEAGVVAALEAAGATVALWRLPAERGLAARLGELLAGEPTDEAGLSTWLAGQETPPFVLLDQFEDVFRFNALHEVEALLAATTLQPARPLCRWLLAYRQEYHGEVRAWLEKPVPGLPRGLLDRFQDWALPPLGASPGPAADLEVARAAFRDAIERPLRLRGPDGGPRYAWSMSEHDADRLALLFARARRASPRDPLAPQFQVVLARLCEEAGPDRVLRPPTPIEPLLVRALERHVVEALEGAFPALLDGGAEGRRTRALLVLRRMARADGRAEAVPLAALRAMLEGDPAEALERLMRPAVRLVVAEVHADGPRYRLSHDRLAEVVRALADPATQASFDRELLRLEALVETRARLHGDSGESAAISLKPKDFSGIGAATSVLIWGARREAWWAACQRHQRQRRWARRLAWLAALVAAVALSSAVGWWTHLRAARREARLAQLARLEERIQLATDPTDQVALRRAQEALLSEIAEEPGVALRLVALRAAQERAARAGGLAPALEIAGAPLPINRGGGTRQDQSLADDLDGWRAGDQPLWAAHLEPDGQHLWQTDGWGQVVRWSTAVGRPTDHWLACTGTGRLKDARSSRLDGAGLVVACYPNHLVRLRPGQRVAPWLTLPTDFQPSELALLPGGGVATAGARLVIWDERGPPRAYGQGADTPLALPAGLFAVVDGEAQRFGVHGEGPPTSLGSAMLLAAAPGGRYLARGWREGLSAAVAIHALPGDDEVARIYFENDGLRTLAFAPDGRRLAVAGRRRVEVWWLDARQPPLVLAGHADHVDALVFAGDRLYSSGWDGRVVAWDLVTGQIVQVGAHHDQVRSLAATPDGDRVASAAADAQVRLWSRDGPLQFSLATAGAALRRPDRPALPNLVVGPGWLATRAPEGLVVLTPDGHRRVIPTQGWPVGVRAGEVVTFTPDDGAGGRLERFDASTGQPRGDSVAVADFLGLVPGGDGRLYRDALGIVELDTGLRVADLPSDGRAAVQVDGTLLRGEGSQNDAQAPLAEGNTLWIGEVLHRVGWGRDIVLPQRAGPVALGQLGATNNFVVRWAPEAPWTKCNGHRASIRDLAFSPDGRLLASVGGGIALWAGGCDRPWLEAAVEGTLARVAFHPTGTLLAVASTDGRVEAHAIPAPGALPAVFQHPVQVLALPEARAPLVMAFVGDALATLSPGGVVQAWRVPPYDPDRTRAELTRRINQRVCPTTLAVAALLPFPTDEGAWAPLWACRPAEPGP